jgi:hypothetical protein
MHPNIIGFNENIFDVNENIGVSPKGTYFGRALLTPIYTPIKTIPSSP